MTAQQYRAFPKELSVREVNVGGMEALRCLTPQMVEKELWVYLLAYNLIRLLMAQAARKPRGGPPTSADGVASMPSLSPRVAEGAMACERNGPCRVD